MGYRCLKACARAAHPSSISHRERPVLGVPGGVRRHEGALRRSLFSHRVAQYFEDAMRQPRSVPLAGHRCDKRREPYVWTNGDGWWIRGAMRRLVFAARGAPHSRLGRLAETRQSMHDLTATLSHSDHNFPLLLPTLWRDCPPKTIPCRWLYGGHGVPICSRRSRASKILSDAGPCENRTLPGTSLPYEAIPVDTSKGEQHAPSFRTINPNGKVPAIVDTDGPGARGDAGLQYHRDPHLSRREEREVSGRARRPTGVALPRLLLIASGLGQFSGQAVHFQFVAPEGIDYAVNRYRREAERHYKKRGSASTS